MLRGRNQAERLPCFRCTKPFGFYMHKVSERRETEVRQEVKEENEALAKKRAQQKRRNARADNRVEAGGGGDEEAQVKEQLFLLLLVDNCPRSRFCFLFLLLLLNEHCPGVGLKLREAGRPI